MNDNINDITGGDNGMDPLTQAVIAVAAIMVGVLIVSLIINFVAIGIVSKKTELINDVLDSLIKRVFSVSLNVENNLVNKITIGTNLGDFVSSLYNAYGIYNIFGSDNSIVKIPISEVFESFHFWVANNDYQNTMFTDSYYSKDRPTTEYMRNNWGQFTEEERKASTSNGSGLVTDLDKSWWEKEQTRSYKLHILPCYLAGVPVAIGSFKNTTWGEGKTYGYEIEYIYSKGSQSNYFDINDYLKITKISNKYTRFELDETKWDDYKDKYFQFLYNNCEMFRNAMQNPNESGNSTSTISISTMYYYYRYFILSNRIMKDVYNSTNNDLYFGTDISKYNVITRKTELEKIINDKTSDETTKAQAQKSLDYINNNSTTCNDIYNGIQIRVANCEFKLTYKNAMLDDQTSSFTCVYNKNAGTFTFGNLNILKAANSGSENTAKSYNSNGVSN